ncbi:nicotinate (nicotinamide) nucleotide adenylyltransferase() [Methylophaga frappieri]|uniref:Probable nicotinate-nucleotide adenylyltransferase n=1 Tax=Methylophaga frappieri (strain ATCC BAA-2434 / DSM 25690 / JAM7) TaxID=754477 RepID=I1YFS4_METFJ|nr:nicotinate-nucleotide adenylyltransferase [Methylophaga frappieri]AFJ01767.1 nicotinate (nicotinamide) nucleotide adenylyltransferase() [Methylophaga frappieri]
MAKFENNGLPTGIGIFGGTFDPVHFGHLRIALEVCQQLNLDHVRLVPCHVPPHRSQPTTDGKARRLLLELAVKSCPSLIVDDIELNRAGPSYSIDTVRALREDYPQQSLYLIVGSDNFRQLDTWRDWQSLLQYAHIVVVRRAGEALDLSTTMAAWLQTHLAKSADINLTEGKVWTLDVTPLAISATTIRAQRAAGGSVQFLLPETVLTAMDQLGLYPTDR